MAAGKCMADISVFGMALHWLAWHYLHFCKMIAAKEIKNCLLT